MTNTDTPDPQPAPAEALLEQVIHRLPLEQMPGSFQYRYSMEERNAIVAAIQQLTDLRARLGQATEALELYAQNIGRDAEGKLWVNQIIAEDKGIVAKVALAALQQGGAQ